MDGFGAAGPLPGTTTAMAMLAHGGHEHVETFIGTAPLMAGLGVGAAPGITGPDPPAAAGTVEPAPRLGAPQAAPASPRYAPATAARWYGKAAAAGDEWAMLELAKLQIEGPAEVSDFAGAARTLQPLATAGVPQAQKLLGDLYDRGQGVRADPARALELHREAALAGDPWAALVMAERYESGRALPRDLDRAREFYTIAAHGGRPSAQRWLAEAELAHATAGREAEAEAHLENAITWYRTAAEAGDGRSLYRLATLHLDGRGMPENPELAVELLERAAAAGEPEAAATLGDLYTLGGPVDRDPERADFWYRAAAEARARNRETERTTPAS